MSGEEKMAIEPAAADLEVVPKEGSEPDALAPMAVPRRSRLAGAQAGMGNAALVRRMAPRGKAGAVQIKVQAQQAATSAGPAATPGTSEGASAEFMEGQPGFWGIDTSQHPKTTYLSVAAPMRRLTDVAAWLHGTADAVEQLVAANGALPEWLPGGKTLRPGKAPLSPAASQSLKMAMDSGTALRTSGMPTGVDPQTRYYKVTLGGQVVTLTEAQYQGMLQGLAAAITRKAQYISDMARIGRETQQDHVRGTSSFFREISNLAAGQRVPPEFIWDVPQRGAQQVIDELTAGPITPDLVDRSARLLPPLLESLNHANRVWHQYTERAIAGAQVAQEAVRDTAIGLIAAAAAAFAAPLVFTAITGVAAMAAATTVGTTLTAGAAAVGVGAAAGGLAAGSAEFVLPGERTDVSAGQRFTGAVGHGAVVGGVAAVGALVAPVVGGAISPLLPKTLSVVGARVVTGGLTGLSVGAATGATQEGILKLPQLVRGELSGNEYLSRIGLSASIGAFFGLIFGGLAGLRGPRPSTAQAPAGEPVTGGAPALGNLQTRILFENPLTGEMVVLGNNPQTGQTGILYYNRFTQSGHVTDLGTGRTATIVGSHVQPSPAGLLSAPAETPSTALVQAPEPAVRSGPASSSWVKRSTTGLMLPSKGPVTPSEAVEKQGQVKKEEAPPPVPEVKKEEAPPPAPKMRKESERLDPMAVFAQVKGELSDFTKGARKQLSHRIEVAKAKGRPDIAAKLQKIQDDIEGLGQLIRKAKYGDNLNLLLDQKAGLQKELKNLHGDLFPNSPAPIAAEEGGAKLLDPATGAEFKPGTKLGSGGSKEVFTVEGHDDLVVGILYPGRPANVIKTEMAILRQLKAEGLATVEIVGETTCDGRPALVMHRYAEGSKNVVALVGDKIRRTGESLLLNQQSIADLKSIRSIMETRPIWINDLQFLIASDGHVVIADPLAIVVGKAPSKNNLRMIDLLIKAAQESIAKALKGG